MARVTQAPWVRGVCRFFPLPVNESAERKLFLQDFGKFSLEKERQKATQ